MKFQVQVTSCGDHDDSAKSVTLRVNQLFTQGLDSKFRNKFVKGAGFLLDMNDVTVFAYVNRKDGSTLYIKASPNNMKLPKKGKPVQCVVSNIRPV